jgi:hypothetical protein
MILDMKTVFTQVLSFTNSLRQSKVISQLCQFVQSLYGITKLVRATVVRYISLFLGCSPRPQIILFFVLGTDSRVSILRMYLTKHREIFL